MHTTAAVRPGVAPNEALESSAESETDSETGTVGPTEKQQQPGTPNSRTMAFIRTNVLAFAAGMGIVGGYGVRAVGADEV